jgi:hypothetical protein
MKRPFTLLALLSASVLCAFCIAGCGDDDDDEDDAPTANPTPTAASASSPTNNTSGRSTGGDSAPNGSASEVGSMVTITDPTEDAFTVEMPEGWKNQAFLVRAYDQHRSVGTSLSPDDQTLLFFGDPKLPIYLEPSKINPVLRKWEHLQPLIKYQSYVEAAPYFTKYIKKKYGNLPDFRLVSTDSSPAFRQMVERKLKRDWNGPLHLTAVRVSFTYTDNGKLMRAHIHGLTASIGNAWQADLCGVSTSGDPSQYDDLLFRIAESHRQKPEWQAKEAERNRRMIAKLKEDHANNMATLRAMGERHQARMSALHAQADASMQNWYQQQAQSDSSHRRFLNYITEENTVVSSSGKTYQVNNQYQRYYINKNDGTYIGTNAFTEQNELGRIPNVNPNDYEEAKIKP